MKKEPGRLRGSGIRTLSADRLESILERSAARRKPAKAGGQPTGARIESVRYRVSGFRDPGTGAWVSRDPRNGHYYRIAGRPRASSERREKGQAARRRTQVRPTPATLARSTMLALEVEIDRGRGPYIYYVSTPGTSLLT